MTNFETSVPLTWPETGLKPHRFAGIFRMLSGDEKEAFDADIVERGLQQKVKIFEDAILDGRNRYVALVENGVFEPEDEHWRDRPELFEEFLGTEAEALEYVWSLNEQRRHDTPTQRAAAAARYANLRNITQAEAAERFNVSERQVSSAEKVIQQGTPELQQAMDDGRLPAYLAEQVADLDEDDQREVAALPKREASAKAREKVADRKPREEPAPPIERVEPLPMIRFTKFAQDMLNFAQAGHHIPAVTVLGFAEGLGIVDKAGVFTQEALAAMGNLAVAAPKQAAEEVRSPLPPAPSRGGHPVEFSVGGLRERAKAHFAIYFLSDGQFGYSTSYSFPSRGGSTPIQYGAATYEDAIAAAAFELTKVFQSIVSADDSVTGDKEKAAARGALHWFGNKLAGWGIVAEPPKANPIDEIVETIADVANEAIHEQVALEQAYAAALAAGAEHHGKHTWRTAEPIMRAGVAASVKREKIAEDIGHPKGTVQGWTAKLKLTDPARLHAPDPALAERNRAKAGAAS